MSANKLGNCPVCNCESGASEFPQVEDEGFMTQVWKCAGCGTTCQDTYKIIETKVLEV